MLHKSLLQGLAPALFLAGLVSATPKPYPADLIPEVLPRDIIPGGKPCGQNNATNRGCWKNNWNISTDYELDTPPGATQTVRMMIANILADLES